MSEYAGYFSLFYQIAKDVKARIDRLRKKSEIGEVDTLSEQLFDEDKFLKIVVETKDPDNALWEMLNFISKPLDSPTKAFGIDHEKIKGMHNLLKMELGLEIIHTVFDINRYFELRVKLIKLEHKLSK